MKKTIGLLVFTFLCLGCSYAQDVAPLAQPPTATPIEWPLRDGDVWVMVGDSITEQKLYTTYMEAFVRARYPKLRFAAVNSGKSGEVYIQGIIRFRNTIAAYKPKLITVNFGMNDHVKVFGGGDFQDDPKNDPQRFIQMAKATGARVLVFSASPLTAPADYGQSVEELLKPANPQQRRERSNPVNRLFADKLRIVAQRNEVPFLDQMALLQIIWGENYARDRVAALRRAVEPVLNTPVEGNDWRVKVVLLDNAIKPFLRNERFVAMFPLPDKENLLAKLPGTRGGDAATWEAFRQYLKGWAAQVDATSPPFVQVSGYDKSSRPTDLIHPNEAGHLHMAGVLLKLMGADGLVSSVAIDAAAKRVTGAQKATVGDISMNNGVLRFKRLDESLPFPIDPLARPALGIDANTSVGSPRDLFGLSRHLLTVNNLPKGNYAVAIDGEVVATVSAEQLARGFDAGLLDRGPIAAQTAKLFDAVRANLLVATPRKNEPPAATVAEPKVLTEAQPVEHIWTLTPVQ